MCKEKIKDFFEGWIGSLISGALGIVAIIISLEGLNENLYFLILFFFGIYLIAPIFWIIKANQLIDYLENLGK